MTYGHWLDQAAHALRAAGHLAGETNADGHASVAAAVAARTQVYRHLVRLVDQIGGPVSEAASVALADQLVNSSRRLATTSTARLLGVGLRAAHSDLAALPPAPGAADTGAVGRHLSDAADRLGIAADILASHLGDPRRRPRTTAGQAIAAGAGQRGALADIARLASNAIETDRRLLGWLARGRPAQSLRPLYRPAVDRLRWWTRGPYPSLLRRIADSSTGESVLRLLEPAPATERSTGTRQVTCLHDVLDTIDTACAWFQQHPRALHFGHARAITRLAVTITRGVTDLAPAAGAGSYAHRWEQVAKKLQHLADLDNSRRDHLVHELVAANDWLHDQLRVHVATRPHTDTPTSRHWHTALSTLRGRLPALARHLHHLVTTAATQGQVCVSQAELDLTAPRRGIFLAKASWRKATPADDRIQTLQRELDGAARVPTDREQALRQALGNPVTIARTAFTHPPTPTGPTTTETPTPASSLAGPGGTMAATRRVAGLRRH